MGSSNFLVFDPPMANMETDAAYAGDTQRSGGAAMDSLFPSVLANKLFYQLTTMVAALAQVMATAGQTVSDASLANLEAAITATFAMLNGNASQAFSAADGATGKQVTNISQFGKSLVANGWQALPGGLILQWMGFTTSTSGYTSATFPLAFPTAPLAVVGTLNTGTPIGVTLIVNLAGASVANVPVAYIGGSGQYLAEPILLFALGY